MKKNNIKKIISFPIIAIITYTVIIACSTDSTDDSVLTDDEDSSDETEVTELHAAYSAFNPDAVTVFLDGSEVVIETTGLPNHETIYWGEGHELYKDEPDVATTPSIMSSNNNATTIRVDATPDLSGNEVDTQLNTIGIAVSGAPFSTIKRVTDLCPKRPVV